MEIPSSVSTTVLHPAKASSEKRITVRHLVFPIPTDYHRAVTIRKLVFTALAAKEQDMNLIGTFPNLTDDERQWLVSNGQTTSYKTGEAFISRGQVVTSLLLIKSGNLRVTRTYLDEMSAEFAGPLGPGEVIGEMSLMDKKGASANLIADGHTEIHVIPGDVLKNKLNTDTEFKARFFESLFLDLIRKLRSTNQRFLPVPP